MKIRRRAAARRGVWVGGWWLGGKQAQAVGGDGGDLESTAEKAIRKRGASSVENKAETWN